MAEGQQPTKTVRKRGTKEACPQAPEAQGEDDDDLVRRCRRVAALSRACLVAVLHVLHALFPRGKLGLRARPVPQHDLHPAPAVHACRHFAIRAAAAAEELRMG